VAHDLVLYTKKVTHHMRGQVVKYIWLTECGYFGLSIMLLFLLLIVFISIFKHWEKNRKQNLSEIPMFYQLRWTRISHEIIGRWNTFSLFSGCASL